MKIGKINMIDDMFDYVFYGESLENQIEALEYIENRLRNALVDYKTEIIIEDNE